jgi:hypothetical protein
LSDQEQAGGSLEEPQVQEETTPAVDDESQPRPETARQTNRSWSELSAADRRSAVRREALRVAALSIGLALVLELLQLVAAVFTGAGFDASTVTRDVLLKVPWAFIVCLALWLAITLSGDRPGTIALVGLVAAPIASLLARSAAELAHAYMAAAAPAAAPSAFLVAGFKGAEYACLGLVVLWLRRRDWSGAFHHAGAGLLIGLVFGGLLLLLIVRSAGDPLTGAALEAWAVNELLFPVGCALILFGAGRH